MLCCFSPLEGILEEVIDLLFDTLHQLIQRGNVIFVYLNGVFGVHKIGLSHGQVRRRMLGGIDLVQHSTESVLFASVTVGHLRIFVSKFP